MARLRLSRDPASVEMVRLIDERERRLAQLRSGRAEAPQSGDPLAFQREVQDAKLDCQRGMLVAQLDRARSTRRDAPTVARLERTLDAFDRNRATLRARVAGRGER